jgi:hypothetical protein
MIFISKYVRLKVFSAHTIIQYLFIFILTYLGPSFLICIFIIFLPIRNFDKFSKSAELFSGQIKVENAALNTKESVIF